MARRILRPVVLVVEDEFLVRMIAVDIIEEAGFEVLEASNADEVILLLEGRSDISVVFTDIDMPGSMDGLKLAHAVRGRWPPVKIIAASGRTLVCDGALAGWRPLSAQALQRETDHERSAGSDSRKQMLKLAS